MRAKTPARRRGGGPVIVTPSTSTLPSCIQNCEMGAVGRGWVKSKNLTLAVQTCQPRLSLALCVLLGSYHVVIIFKYLISCQHLQIGRFHIKVWISIFPRKITRSGSSGSSSPLWCPLASAACLLSLGHGTGAPFGHSPQQGLSSYLACIGLCVGCAV